MVKILNSDNFYSEVTNSEKPVLVDFYAAWCGPCRMLAPIIDELSNEPIGQKIDFVKLDIDAASDIAENYGVMSVPTMILFVNGDEQIRMVGVQPKDTIAGTIGEYV